MRVAGSNAVLHLNDLPLLSAFDDGALVELSFFPVKALFLPRSPKALELGSAGRSCRAAGGELTILRDGAVTVCTHDLDGVTRFAVKLAGAMRISLEVAINAVHPFFKMDIFQVNRLLELFGIIGRYQGPVLIQQVAFP